MNRPFTHAGLLAALLLVSAGGLLAFRTQDPIVMEPVFRGEPLALWIARLDDLDPDVQNVAAFAVGRFGGRASSALPSLARMLTTNDITRNLTPIRSNAAAAAEAVGEVGLATNTVVEGLASLASHRNTLSRVGHETARTAIRALAKLGMGAGAAVPALTKILQRPLPQHPTPFQDLSPLQREAARALGQIGPAATAAIPALEQVETDSRDVMLSIAARHALAQIKSAPSPPDPTGERRRQGGK